MKKYLKYLVLISCIVGIIFFAYDNRYIGEEDASLESTKSIILSVGQALDLYVKDFGYYPSTEEGLIVLTKPGKNKNFYIDQLKKDAWKQSLIYAKDTDINSFVLYSIGKNGLDESGKGDDINYFDLSSNQ